ncbi:uncharacterized protein PGTG_19725 [Puccinia graminis f. sp. tritici CRL 75-36-700-3]|uniref:SUN domain-containing protein n=1 Tax=Puccinia graminis f. sp. tritici (strain CRL 75-36-700-3 / race SCCL) TaxID=418459 RepID=E3LB16_PUCGT|nr:uncharacterized protein PGTG_19725 [Puccinia graminis f. sp. tritici CRL 75-36-700-3]EFP93741.2 hypothetical protein PGTG_19725 [Puccinia graminis f. sp. tritici CRL 75-36-700-3]
MYTPQSNRPRQLSHDARRTNPKYDGTFGRKAAIGWKWLKKNWFLTGTCFLCQIVTTRKESSLDEKVTLLDQRLVSLEEQGLNTAADIKSLIDGMLDVVKRSEFEEVLLLTENRWGRMSGQAKQEGHESIVTPRKDFASFSAGASIIDTLTSPTWSNDREIQPSKFTLFKKSQKVFGSPPLTVLVSDLSLGICWPFHGTTGQIGIRLSRTIWVEGITIGHVPRSLAYDIRTAPKQFELWGLDHGNQEVEGNLLLEGTYSIHGLENVQEFLVPKTRLQLHSKVVLKIKSNHGNPDLTCIYRVQVHGKVKDNHENYDLDHVTPT